MKTFIAFAAVLIFGLHLITRIRFFIKNRNTRIRVIRNTIDIFLSMGIMVLSILEIRGRSNEGRTDSYIWYILGLLGVYIVWAKINVSSYRNNQKRKGNNASGSKYKVK